MHQLVQEGNFLLERGSAYPEGGEKWKGGGICVCVFVCVFVCVYVCVCVFDREIKMQMPIDYMKKKKKKKKRASLEKNKKHFLIMPEIIKK